MWLSVASSSFSQRDDPRFLFHLLLEYKSLGESNAQLFSYSVSLMSLKFI